MNTVEVRGNKNWGEYVGEAVEQSTEEERLALYGIESNTETEGGETIAEIKVEFLGKTVGDYLVYCEHGNLEPGELVVTPA